MTINILAFGIIKEIFESTTAVLAVEEGTTAAGIKSSLEEKYPALKKLGSYMIAINNDYAEAQTIIHAGDEVAIIPPVSGG